MSKRKRPRIRTGSGPLPEVEGTWWDWTVPLAALLALVLAGLALAAAGSNQRALNRLQDQYDAMPKIEVGGGAIEVWGRPNPYGEQPRVR